MSGIFDGLVKREVRPDPDAPTPPLPPEAVSQGSFWTLYRRDGAFILRFMSGQVAGFEKEIGISAAEANALQSGGDAAAVKVINLHGGG